MKRKLVLAIAAAGLSIVTGCGASHAAVSPPVHLSIPADKPPSPATWPAYPKFTQRSCWGRPTIGGPLRVDRNAPSYLPAPRSRPIPPRQIARRFLARFGDPRYVHAITFNAASRRARHAKPPPGSLHAFIRVRGADARTLGRHPSHARSLEFGIANWESQLVGGALRDDFCAAGGAPLVSWSALPADGSGTAYQASALEERFPNPSPPSFRHRVALVGRRYGFRVVSLRLLRPEQIAPLLVVETSRNRKAFVRDIPAIMDLLNPSQTTGSRTAETFEAFFFAAEDDRGPFVDTQFVSRGESESGEWAWNRCDYPYPVIGPIGTCKSSAR